LKGFSYRYNISIFIRILLYALIKGFIKNNLIIITTRVRTIIKNLQM